MPVQGKLFDQGRPAAGAKVFFQPQDSSPAEEWIGGFPRSTVADDGSFVVGTYGDADGAPPGEYVLTVLWLDESKAESGDAPPPDKLQGRYKDPASSPLRVTVQSQATELEPIDLQ